MRARGFNLFAARRPYKSDYFESIKQGTKKAIKQAFGSAH